MLSRARNNTFGCKDCIALANREDILLTVAASQNNHTSCLMSLIEHDENAMCDTEAILCNASQNGNLDVLRWSQERPSPWPLSSQLAMMTAKGGHDAAISLLDSYGYDWTAINCMYLALQAAIIWNHFNVVKRLVAISIQNALPISTKHIAAAIREDNDDAILNHLLAIKIPITDSALYVAISTRGCNAFFDIFKKILDGHVVVDSFGQMAVSEVYAKSASDAACYARCDILAFLKNHDPEAFCREGNTMLFRAIGWHNFNTVNELIRLGCSLSPSTTILLCQVGDTPHKLTTLRAINPVVATSLFRASHLQMAANCRNLLTLGYLLSIGCEYDERILEFSHNLFIFGLELVGLDEAIVWESAEEKAAVVIDAIIASSRPAPPFITNHPQYQRYFASRERNVAALLTTAVGDLPAAMVQKIGAAACIMKPF